MDIKKIGQVRWYADALEDNVPPRDVLAVRRKRKTGEAMLLIKVYNGELIWVRANEYRPVNAAQGDQPTFGFAYDKKQKTTYALVFRVVAAGDLSVNGWAWVPVDSEYRLEKISGQPSEEPKFEVLVDPEEPYTSNLFECNNPYVYGFAFYQIGADSGALPVEIIARHETNKRPIPKRPYVIVAAVDGHTIEVPKGSRLLRLADGRLIHEFLKGE